MRVLFVSGELIAGDLAVRLKQEGCDVRLYVAHPTQQECLDGFLDKIDDWEAELGWVGKDGLIVFDDVGYGEIQDRLRGDGYRVVGGSAGGDRLELDREFAQTLFSRCGMKTEPTLTFPTAADALSFLKAHRGTWVVKQGDHQSHLNYVGVMDDGSDVIGILESYKRLKIANVSLQRKLVGIEVAVARYFNGADWVGAIEISLEHKGLMNQELGPKTGEMGTLMWYAEEGENRLFEATLARLKPYLTEVNYRGNIDINCFVNGDEVRPIEATARFGCPSTHLRTALYLTPWTELLSAIADGKHCDLRVREDYGIVVCLTVPPFPYDGGSLSGVSSRGLPLFFQSPLTEDERSRLHFEGVALSRSCESERHVLTTSLGYAAFVTGTGSEVKDAQRAAYGLARKIVIPKVMYRTDIGDRFLLGDRDRLLEYGWI